MNPIINNSIRQKMLDLFLKETDNVYLIYFDYNNITNAADVSASILTNVKFYHDYTGEFRPGYKGPVKQGLGTTKILGITYSYLTDIPGVDEPLKENTIVKADNSNGLYYTYLIAPNTEIVFSAEINYRGVALVANAVVDGIDLDFTESDIIFIQTFNDQQKQDAGTKQVPLVVNF